MCGVDWYREAFIKAEDSKEQLTELMKMIEERYEISSDHPEEWQKLHLNILTVYKDVLRELAKFK